MADPSVLAEILETSPIDLTSGQVEIIVEHFRTLYIKSSSVTSKTVTNDKTRKSVTKQKKVALTPDEIAELAKL